MLENPTSDTIAFHQGNPNWKFRVCVFDRRYEWGMSDTCMKGNPNGECRVAKSVNSHALGHKEGTKNDETNSAGASDGLHGEWSVC